ncbi:MAG: hypothetical protein Q7U24_10325, partial [Sulfurimicrobium sp.]|nr:hypothetical protein [Sulfurimicrobium sp.]
YRLGDRMQVKVMRVDLETSKVDFAVVKDEGPLVAAAPGKPRTTKPRSEKSQAAGSRRRSKPKTEQA